MPLTIPPYEGQGWTDNSTPDLSAETLNAVDDGIAAVTNGVNAIAAAVVSQIINDPEKIASIAVAYAQQQQINTINTNLTLKADKSDLNWKMYNTVSQLGLDFDCTMDQVLIALSSKGSAILMAPIFKTDYPNLALVGAGARHILKVEHAFSGYVAITDYDISNGICFFTSHDGNGYKAWTSTKPI